MSMRYKSRTYIENRYRRFSRFSCNGFVTELCQKWAFECLSVVHRINRKKSRKTLILRDLSLFQRRDRDSNPGYLAVQRFSRPPQSTTLPPLQDFFFQKYFPLKSLQRYDFILNKQIVYQFFCYKIFKSYFCIRIINERNKS